MNLPGPTSDAQLFYTELRPIQIEWYDIAQIASPSARASIDSNHAFPPPPKTPIRSTGITIYKTPQKSASDFDFLHKCSQIDVGRLTRQYFWCVPHRCYSLCMVRHTSVAVLFWFWLIVYVGYLASHVRRHGTITCITPIVSSSGL